MPATYQRLVRRQSVWLLRMPPLDTCTVTTRSSSEGSISNTMGSVTWPVVGSLPLPHSISSSGVSPPQ